MKKRKKNRIFFRNNEEICFLEPSKIDHTAITVPVLFLEVVAELVFLKQGGIVQL